LNTCTRHVALRSEIIFTNIELGYVFTDAVLCHALTLTFDLLILNIETVERLWYCLLLKLYQVWAKSDNPPWVTDFLRSLYPRFCVAFSGFSVPTHTNSERVEWWTELLRTKPNSGTT